MKIIWLSWSVGWSVCIKTGYKFKYISAKREINDFTMTVYCEVLKYWMNEWIHAVTVRTCIWGNEAVFRVCDLVFDATVCADDTISSFSILKVWKSGHEWWNWRESEHISLFSLLLNPKRKRSLRSLFLIKILPAAEETNQALWMFFSKFDSVKVFQGGFFSPFCVSAASLLSVEVFFFFLTPNVFALRCYLLSNNYLGKSSWLCLNVFVNV